MIVPAVGRVVLFVPKETSYAFGFAVMGGREHNAHIAYVHTDRLVNLTVSDAHGKTFGLTSVTLVQPGDPTPGGDHCRWMDYQVEQAKKWAGKPNTAKQSA